MTLHGQVERMLKLYVEEVTGVVDVDNPRGQPLPHHHHQQQQQQVRNESAETVGTTPGNTSVSAGANLDDEGDPALRLAADLIHASKPKPKVSLEEHMQRLVEEGLSTSELWTPSSFNK